MPLTPENLKRRINAAAALHGWRMNDLPQKLEEFGAQKHLAAGLADGRLEPRPALLTILANFFGVPEMWFTEEDWSSLVKGETNYAAGVREGLKRQDEQLRMLRETVTRLSRIELRLAHSEGDQEGAELAGLEADEAASVPPPEAKPERSSEQQAEGENG